MKMEGEKSGNRDTKQMGYDGSKKHKVTTNDERKSQSKNRSPSLCSSATRVAGQSGSNSLRLDTAKSLELLGLHGDLLPEANLASSALDERHTIRVQRLVDGGSARLGTSDGDTGGGDGSSGGLDMPVAEVLDDSSLHGELDQVKGQEPDDVPDPNDTDPSTRDGVDLGEAPVTEPGDDG